MAKMTLEFDLEEELEAAKRVLAINEVFSIIWDFEQTMRSASKYKDGLIWKEFLREKEEYPEESDEQNMLDATRKVYYELTESIRELIE